jgi:hypothetical protein
MAEIGLGSFGSIMASPNRDIGPPLRFAVDKTATTVCVALCFGTKNDRLFPITNHLPENNLQSDLPRKLTAGGVGRRPPLTASPPHRPPAEEYAP